MTTDKEWQLPTIVTSSSPFQDQVEAPSSDYAIIFLNQPIDTQAPIFPKLFRNAKLKICADGGANRLYSALTSSEQNSRLHPSPLLDYLPDYICGDLDSLQPDVEAFYKSKGVPILSDSCQNSTDLDKCYALVKKLESEWDSSEVKKLSLMIYGGIGGRFDHNFAAINFLYKIPVDREVIIFTPENLALLLWPGYRHVIPLDLIQLGPACGLIPIGGKVSHCLTEGLRWNLAGQELAFGLLVSTSNLADHSPVIVNLSSPCPPTSPPLLFTIEVAPHPPSPPVDVSPSSPQLNGNIKRPRATSPS